MLPIPDWNIWQISLFALTCLAWIVQLIYMLRYFLPVARYRAGAEEDRPVPVTVVISARNEEKNLMEHIPVIMEQDHPEFEVIVVNDSSWDDTGTILKALELRYPKLRVIHLDEEKQNMQGKKFALTLAIKAAKYEHMVFTDADCQPASASWLRRMASGYTEGKELVLGFSPLTRKPGWLNRIIRYDTLLAGMQYIGFARRGNAYMGVGRNLSYKKELFFRVGGFRSHYRLASGDDDLFVNQVATRKNVSVVAEPEAHTFSAPKTTWKDWFAQKRRHFTTAPFYRAEHRNLLGLWPFSFYLLIMAGIASCVVNAGLWIVGGLLLGRYLVLIATLQAACKRLNQSADLVWLAPFLEFHLHALHVGLYFSNLLRKPQKWT